MTGKRNQTLLLFILLCMVLIGGISAQSRRNTPPAQSRYNYNVTPDTSAEVSTSVVPLDSLLPLTPDTLAVDTTPKKKKTPLDAPVDYTAQDSMIILGTNMAFLYGAATVRYQDIGLDAAEIKMNLDSSLVFAEGTPDSIGTLQGTPIFKDPSGEYNSKTLKYSFTSQKGYITNVVTQQGEGYLIGGRTKKMKEGCLFMTDGKYTTCDNHDHPHFYLQLTKAKVVPKKNIVTGPAYMVLADVPLPLAIPFGFFPFNSKYSSGIIVPTFGDEMTRGFYLSNGGYYFAINDHIDLALTGEIYTKGSWGINAQSAYVKRYKYQGSFNMGYLVSVFGDKGMPDYQQQTNFRLLWNHTQDTKSNPNLNFSANVNFTTSGYNRNNIESYYNPSQFTENTKSSSVNLSYNFPYSPFSLSTTANITQRSQDSTLAVSFPDVMVSMSRIYPFKRKVQVGKARWYEKISLSYSGSFRNSITSNQDQILKKSLLKDWRNGIQHSIPISATFTALKYLNITPSISLNDKMYFSRIDRQWDPNGGVNRVGAEVQDTTFGFYNVLTGNFSLSAQTKLYGFYKPLPFLGDKVEMIRHVFTPSVTFSAAPDFGDPFFGYWKSYERTDAQGKVTRVDYSPYSAGIFGGPGRGKQGILSLGITNNLEMKVRTDRDTTGVRKISLIENLSAGISYNMAADSMRWSNINSSILIKLTKGFNLQLSAIWDTYTYALNSAGTGLVRVNKTRLEAGKGLGRLSSTGTSFSYTFNNATFQRKPDTEKKKKSKKKETAESESENEEFGSAYDAPALPPAEEPVYSDGYVKWEVPWSLSFNYSINYGYGTPNLEKLEYNGKITQNLSFSGSISPTKNWSFSLSSSFDFETKRMAYMSCSITRDLHCFSMTANFIPVGPYKSYNFSIAVKSSLLSDLKYKKSSSPYDIVNW